jgi:hypothetical protein
MAAAMCGTMPSVHPNAARQPGGDRIEHADARRDDDDQGGDQEIDAHHVTVMLMTVSCGYSGF